MSGPGALTPVRRVVVRRPGGYERLRVERGRLSPPREGEVLVEVCAAGVNYADSLVRMGLYQSARELVGWPITPGFEVAGHVRAVGPGVTAHRVGAPVMAVTLFGGYASHVVVPAHQVFALPAPLDMTRAASLPSVFMTAWYALFELAHPRPGYRALVHSAAGGVGTTLLQLLRIAQVEAVGVVGAAHKVQTARDHGATHVIDRSSEDLWAAAERLAPHGYDLILDANGVATLAQSYRHLRRPGKLVVYGFHSMISGARPRWLRLAASYLRTPRFDPFELTTHSKSVLAFNLSYLFDRTDLLALAMEDARRWLEDGSLRAPPVQTFALDAAADAQRAIESGQTVGKLVLLP